jgi:hypothetical protein
VYPSLAAVVACAEHWQRITARKVKAAAVRAGNLDRHPHGAGGVHPLPGGVAHSGYQVDVTRNLHLVTFAFRLAVVPTPFGWVTPGGGQEVLQMSPGAVSITGRLANGELAVSLDDSPVLSLYNRRIQHFVPVLEGQPTYLSVMWQAPVEAPTMEEAVAIASAAVAAAVERLSSCGPSASPSARPSARCSPSTSSSPSASSYGASSASARGSGSSDAGSAPALPPFGFLRSFTAFMREFKVAGMHKLWRSMFPTQRLPSSFTQTIAIRPLYAGWLARGECEAAGGGGG